jgi:hypothetical protein
MIAAPDSAVVETSLQTLQKWQQHQCKEESGKKCTFSEPDIHKALYSPSVEMTKSKLLS